jgi:GTPase
MLVDKIDVIFKGGYGGAGIVSFGPMEKSGPDGGNGGRGGDLYIRALDDITLLNQFTQISKFQGGDGHMGGKNKMTGKDGRDLEILLPVGTSLIDRDTKELIIELTEKNQTILLCKGGKGGRGNWEFRSARNTTPKKAQSGKPGEIKNLTLELKLIADYGLIGLPNAGKSSLLNEITNADVKVGNYAFTTLSPNLAVIHGKIIADIPGLIEGASDGKGLGISFLKHIEKVGVLLHCVAADSENVKSDYETVRTELGNYKKELLNKKEIILLTKSDLVDKKKLKEVVSILKTKRGQKIIPVSIHDWNSMKVLDNLFQ